MIMKGRAPLRLPIVGFFCLAIVAMAALPAWATSQQTPPPSPPVVIQQTTSSPVVVSQTRQTPPVPVSQTRQTPPPVPVMQTTPPTPPAAGRPVSVPLTRTNTVRQTPPSPPVPMQHQTPVLTAQRFHFTQATSLPEDGQKLIQGFDADREAIQKEVDQKIQARREAVIKELERLQDQYAKAGKLDEAVAIRDYLRAGGPATAGSVAFRRIAR